MPGYQAESGGDKRSLQANEIRLASLRAGLEADHGVALQGFVESTQRVDAAVVLAALDPRDDRLHGAHPSGQILAG